MLTPHRFGKRQSQKREEEVAFKSVSVQCWVNGVHILLPMWYLGIETRTTDCFTSSIPEIKMKILCIPMVRSSYDGCY